MVDNAAAAKQPQSGPGPGTPAAQPKQPEAPARLVPPMSIDRMQLSEFNTAQYTAILHAGVEPEDILPVAYWSHVAEMLQQNMTIVATTEDMKWRGELVVVDSGRNWARVVFKTTEDGKRFITKLGGLQPHKIVLLPGHTVNYAGIFSKWRIVRDADGRVLSDKHNTEGDAYGWLSDYAKSNAT